MILSLPVTENYNRPVIRVSDLRQWTYCQRSIWWIYVCPVGKRLSYKMRLGMQKERRLQNLQRRRSLHAFKQQDGNAAPNIDLYAPRLGLSGKLDMLITHNNRRIPVEIKFTTGGPRLDHRIQLAGYCMMLEELYGDAVPFGFLVLLPDQRVERVQIDEALRDLVVSTLQCMRATIITERMPSPNPHPGRCVDCENRLFCGDVQ